MAPRLRWLLLLLPAGCAAPVDQDALALREAMASGQASLAAIAAAPPGFESAAFVDVPRPRLARLDYGALPVRSTATGARPQAAAELLGAGPEALRVLLGEPSLRRHEGNAEVWLYAGDACALDLVLYPAGGGLRVAHAAARASGAEARSEAACLQAIGAPPSPRPSPAGGVAAGGGNESGA